MRRSISLASSEIPVLDARISFEPADGSALLAHLGGRWHLQRALPGISVLLSALAARPDTRRIQYDSTNLTYWDTSLISFLSSAAETCRSRGILEDRSGLPGGVRRLLELAETVPEKKGARAAARAVPLLERIGNVTIGYGLSAGEFLGFIGELSVAFGKFLRRKARYRTVDSFEVVQECGPSAVGIVSLSRQTEL